MSIAIKNSILTKEDFNNEFELQDYLEQCPKLVSLENEPEVAFVDREVKLPSAGILDILLVDATGCPIAVEVKLSRNSQSRREVVAQAFDYISDLSRLTIDELDELVGAKLSQALDILESDNNLWKICGTNLRAGNIKLVIAVDDANEDLIRIVRYTNEHSDLDVRLISINKFKKGDILVPNIIVAGNSSFQKNDPKTVYKNQRFISIVDLYDSIAETNFKCRNSGKRYRLIYPDGWPWSVHYEFCNYQHTDQIGVELHLEEDVVKFLANILKKYDGEKLLNSYPLIWDPKFSKNRGRLKVLFSNTDNPEEVAQSMKQLIDLTKKEIDDELTKHSS